DDDEEEEEESSKNDDDEEEEKEAYEEDNEEEGHLAPADSTLPAIDSVPSVKETEPFEIDESAATPPPLPISPRLVVPLSSTRLRRARISVQPHTPPSPSTKALILEYAFAPTPPSPLPSPLSPLSFPLFRIPSLPLLLPHLHTSPTYARAPLSYRASIV
ncbi:hypothetical protein Tco_1396899, partial [Tanacetum coccineum]